MSKFRNAVWFVRDAASILTIGAAFAIGSPQYRERMMDIWETGADVVDNRRGPAPVRISDEEWEKRVREGLPRTGWGGWRDASVCTAPRFETGSPYLAPTDMAAAYKAHERDCPRHSNLTRTQFTTLYWFGVEPNNGDTAPTPAQIAHADEILDRGGRLCDRAPAGWWCHLELNHDGPCPATSA